MWYIHFLSQDDFGAISSGIVSAAVVIVLGLTQRKRGKKRILITDYRRGVRFANGVFTAVLPPGTHIYSPERDQITIIDMRPQPILIERQTFQDAVGTQAIISMGAELLVTDPHLAATALRDQVKDAYVIVREILRSTVTRQVVSSIGDNSQSIEEALIKAINGELGKVGMRVSEIEITELWAGSLVMQPGAASGVVQ